MLFLSCFNFVAQKYLNCAMRKTLTLVLTKKKYKMNLVCTKSACMLAVLFHLHKRMTNKALLLLILF